MSYFGYIGHFSLYFVCKFSLQYVLHLLLISLKFPRSSLGKAL